MQRRKHTTLSLAIVASLALGCSDDPASSSAPGRYYCSLPDETRCSAYAGEADEGFHDYADAGWGAPWADAGAYDAGVSAQDAGADDASVGGDGGTDEPGELCAPEDCEGVAPAALVCPDESVSVVRCMPSFFGPCEWHFVCGPG